MCATTNTHGTGYCFAKQSEQAFVLLGRREGLYKIPLSGTNIVRLSESSDNFLYGVDYDYEEGKIFWTERNQNAVYTSPFNKDTNAPLQSVGTIYMLWISV